MCILRECIWRDDTVGRVTPGFTKSRLFGTNTRRRSRKTGVMLCLPQARSAYWFPDCTKTLFGLTNYLSGHRASILILPLWNVFMEPLSADRGGIATIEVKCVTTTSLSMGSGCNRPFKTQWPLLPKTSELRARQCEKGLEHWKPLR